MLNKYFEMLSNRIQKERSFPADSTWEEYLNSIRIFALGKIQLKNNSSKSINLFSYEIEIHHQKIKKLSEG